MVTLQSLQKIWQQTIVVAALPKQLKSWPHFSVQNKKQVKPKSPLVSHVRNAVVEKVLFSKSPLALQKKYLQSLALSKEEVLAARLLLGIEDHWLIKVKIDGEASLHWQTGNTGAIAVGFILQGQGSLTMYEQASAWQSDKFVLLQVGTDLKVHYIVLQNFLADLQRVVYQNDLAVNAQLFWTTASHCQGNMQIGVLTFCRGRGSDSEISFGLHMSGMGRSHISLLNEHQDSDSKGNMLIKTVARESAQAVVEAMIKIDKKSFNTNSYLKEDTLLLSPQAKVVALPNLEIKNRDVKASHGATIGHFDPALRFYLASRGLNIQAVEHLLLSGFFQPIGSKIKDDTLRKELLDVLTFNH